MTTTEATAVKLLDEVLVLYGLFDEHSNTVERCRELIGRYKTEHPEHPITISLYRYLQENDYT